MTLAPTKINNKNSVYIRKVHSEIKKIDTPFLEWLTGFVDAEGNFNISLRNYISQDNKYNSLILTFQIGLHIDDLEVLKFIQKKLGCGKISISKNRCNFFVNDQASLINIICPVFNLVQLKSSKYFQFLIFEKAVNLIKNKGHLTDSGRNEIIKFYHEIKNPSIYLEASPALSHLNKYWLGGFVDGDASFSAHLNRPVFKFENHVKELPLFRAIVDYFQFGNINTYQTKNNSRQVVTIEFNNIHFLKIVIVSLFTKTKLLNSKKLKDFNDFCTLVDVYYYGYHTIPEGESLAREIISNWNNFRLSTYKTPFIDFNKKYQILSNIPSPYTIKDGGLRFYRNTLKLVSDKIKITAIDHLNNVLVFSSISECSRILQIDRYTIKKYLLNGQIYKIYRFKFNNFIYFDRKEG
uniref:LAGLIDADG endonuclease n=1 Tax=Ganoderma tsugae TaxID=2075311 RepID=A0A2S1WBA5_GANTS|nr:LAGLIDADG endonuclease [Ganoderma tsugae]AWJ63866.1 LAGLIDADG endonuclease [Ganoderma tsugae]